MVSVIVPVYNTKEYLDACIRSIVSQSCYDLEILLIDDCSTDGSSEIMDTWAGNDSRIRAVHKKCHSGVSESRNIGLNICKGDFISFIDSDDWIEPDFYSKLLYWIEKTESDIAFCGYDRIGQDDSEAVPLKGATGERVSVEEALLQCMPQRGQGRYNLFLWDKLFRRAAICADGQIPTFDQSITYCEDVLWLIHAMMKCTHIVYCNEMLYHYRAFRSGNSFTSLSRLSNLEYCESALRANKASWKLLKDNGSKAENNAFQRVLFYQRYAFRTADHLKEQEAYREYRKGYLTDLIKWYMNNRSYTGLKWVIRQLGSDFIYQLKRIK